jgi:hypothetical protein
MEQIQEPVVYARLAGAMPVDEQVRVVPNMEQR